jgi:hypothetical protein
MALRFHNFTSNKCTPHTCLDFLLVDTAPGLLFLNINDSNHFTGHKLSEGNTEGFMIVINGRMLQSFLAFG